MNIGYKLIKNCMAATAEKAPYLGMAIPAGSLAYDNILREMIKSGTKMTQPTAKYFLDALYEYAAQAIADEVVRINIGTVTLQPAIDGSFDSEDANFDPKRNSLYVGASFSQELRDRVAGIAPDYAGDKSVGTVKLRTCMDLERQLFKVIDGLNAFRLAGENLTVPDGSDESLGFYAKDGVTKVTGIEVSETDGGQWIKCNLQPIDTVIPRGTYKVRLASHGLDPTDPLTVATLTVTLLEDIPAIEPPHYPAMSKDGTTTVTGFCDSDGEEVEFITDGIVDFVGTGLGRITTNGEWRESADAEWKTALIGVPPEEGEPLGFALEGQTEPGEYPNAEFKLPHPSGDMIVPFGYKYEE